MIVYHWPIPGVRPEFPWGRYPSGGYHPAYDFGVPTGTAVHAPASGTIWDNGWDTTGYGWHVRIRHSNGHMSILAHGIEGSYPPVGTVVWQDERVLTSDNSGRSSGPHCHWETRTSTSGLQRDTAYDPGPYVNLSASDPSVPADPTAPTGPSQGQPTAPYNGWSLNQAGIWLPPAKETIAKVTAEQRSQFAPPMHGAA